MTTSYTDNSPPDEIICDMLANGDYNETAQADDALDEYSIRGAWYRDSDQLPVGFIGFDYDNQRWLTRGWRITNKKGFALL